MKFVKSRFVSTIVHKSPSIYIVRDQIKHILRTESKQKFPSSNLPLSITYVINGRPGMGLVVAWIQSDNSTIFSVVWKWNLLRILYYIFERQLKTKLKVDLSGKTRTFYWILFSLIFFTEIGANIMLVSILCFLDIIYLQTNKKQIENVNFNIFLCFTIWIELLKNFTRFLSWHLQLQICLVFITNLMKFLLPRQNENFIKLRPLRNNGLKSFLINHTYYSECCFKKKSPSLQGI